MSQSREKPKLVALPPPAHQAMQEITFMHSVPEYTADSEKITGAVTLDKNLRGERVKLCQTVQRWLVWKNKELTHPKRVDSAHQLLMGCRNFIFNVLVKAWFYSQKLEQWRKIVDTIWNRKSTLNTGKIMQKEKMWLKFY